MITIEAVPVAEVLACEELIAEYARECSIAAIGEIAPHAGAYAAMEASGLMQCFVAREAKACMAFEDEDEAPVASPLVTVVKTVGFAIVLTPVLPHYSRKVATVESLFVAERSRSTGAGRDLMRAVEKYAAESGCVGILYSSPVGGQLERLLQARTEYERTNAVFFRRLT